MQELDAILEETAAALATFDLDGLQQLLQRAEALRDAGCVAVSGPVAARHKRLNEMLCLTESNLGLLERLRSRGAGHPWER